jgi:serine/threonine protein kinase
MHKLGHYEIKGVIGVGSMGRVYAGFDTHLERIVAIKTLKSELAEDPEFIRRFQAEAKNLAKLFHPNITTLLSTDLDRPDPYMVMEYVDGSTLEEILSQRPSPLDLTQALAIISQAADGISYAHEHGIVHRDLKPSNIKISAQGKIKIMDFGIARICGSSRMTRIGNAVGTPLYMSPEQCMGKEGDERSDEYSLSIIFYEMITGSTPFAASTEYEILQGHINRKPTLPSRLVGTPAKIDRVLDKAMSKRPHDRYSSVMEFSQALGAFEFGTQSKSIVKGSAQLIAPTSEAVHGSSQKSDKADVRGHQSISWLLHPAYLFLALGAFAIFGYTAYKINAGNVERLSDVSLTSTSASDRPPVTGPREMLVHSGLLG